MRYVMIAVVLFVSAVSFAQEPRQRTLKLDDYLEWEWVGSPQLSPDGKHVVYTRSWVDKLADSRKSELWIMRADGSRKRFLTQGSSPRWSPSGDRIAFLRTGKPRGSQIFVMWVDTREVTQLTRLLKSPGALRWSPDGEHLAFSMLVDTSKKFLPIKLPKRPKGAKWAPEPKVITRLNYRRDRSGYRPKGFRHIFVVGSREGGTPRQLTTGDFDHRGGEWAPDGKRIVFSGLRVKDADWQLRESEIYSVDVKTREIVALTTRVGFDASPLPSPDGKHICYIAGDKNRDTYNVARLQVMGADGSSPRELAPGLDRQVSGMMWSRDSRHVYFNVTSEGARHVWVASVDGGAPRQLTKGRSYVTATSLGSDGRLVGTKGGPHEPGDVVAMRASDTMTSMSHLTRVNADVLADVELGAVEEFRYRSVGDFEIQGWIVKPPRFDPSKKYPMILQIHGGPHGMYGNRFSFERQDHAANGFVVLYTNPRGSSGYGKRFGNAIKNAYPGRDYDDLMRGVDAVIAKGYVDPDRLFVYGGSGGGVLTAWIVGKTHRFKAAVSMFPVTNWISFVGTTDGPYWYTNFEKLPWEDISEHWRRSPLRLVGNVKTPTLLITGELDLRTPMAQTEEYYQALKLRKVDTAMVRVPGEYHGAAGRHFSNRLRRILYVRGWFEKYMPGKKAKSASPMEATSTSGK